VVAPLRVRIFGNVQVEGLDFAALGSRKQRTLLRLLAVGRGEPVSVDRLTDCLWPGQLPSRPADQVGVLVSRLRAVLGADRVPRSDAGYALAADWIDVLAFEAVATQAQRRLAEDQPAAAATAAQAGLALAARPLLADEPDAPWADEARRPVDRTVSELRAVAAQASLAAGDPFGAASAAQAVLDQDPYDEHALRLLMTAHARAGRPGAALAAYARAREQLAEVLGASPSALTDEIHLAILRDEIAPAPDPTPDLRGTGGNLPGRDREWSVLDDSLIKATGQVAVIVIEGEAGMGKTRLLEEWSASKAGGIAILWGTCDPIGAALPFQPVLDALHRHLSRIDETEARRLVAQAGPVLGPLLPGYPGPASVPDPLTAQAALFGAALALCCQAGDSGAVLVLDDVHVADAATLTWLGFASRRPEAGSLLIVAALRPEADLSIRGATRVRLGPLDLASVVRIVGAERAPALLERSDGNPLFLVELASFAGEDLPASILEVVSARCAQAGAAEQTLRTAAVLGPELDLDLLAGVMQASAVDLLDDLEEGRRLLILEEQGLTFRFRHELVREALVAGTGPTRRALAHRQAAHLLAARPRWDPLLVATHARQGGDLELAARALVAAARQASVRFDHREAERLLGDSLALFPTAAAHLVRGRVRLTTEQFAEASADAREALALGARAESLELASWSAYYQRHFDEARSLCREAQLAVDTDDTALRSSILALGGRIAHADGDLETAQDDLESAVSAASALDGAGVGKVWLGWLMIDRGDLEGSMRLVSEVADDASLTSHPFAPAHRALVAAYTSGLQGRMADALAHLEVVDREVDVRKLHHFAGRTANYRAWLLRNLLRESEADDLNRAAAEMARARGLREAQVQADLDLADAHLRRGELADALRALRDVEAVGTGFAFDWKAGLRGDLLMARLMLEDGRPEEAVAVCDDLEDRATGLATPRYRTLAQALGIRARALSGHPVDPPSTEDVLRGLRRFATPEAWWVTAELARDLRIEGLWGGAERMIGVLVEGAGSRGAEFGRQAGKRLDRMRSSRRRD
jgi:DNA-binding SARP family transcriptional activator